MARPDLHELGNDDGLISGAGAGALPVAGAHGRDEVQGGLALEGEVAEEDALLVALAVAFALPLVGGEEEEGGVGLGQQALQPEPEFERLGVTQVGEDDSHRPFALGGDIEGIVCHLDGDVGELAGGGGELGEGLLDRGVIRHGEILAVAVGRTSAGAPERGRGDNRAMEPVERRVQANGVELAYFERDGSEPLVLFAHATGFHARCWDAVAEAIDERSIAVDLRGHGRSEKPEPPYPWGDVADDVAAFCEALDVRGAIGVGHSKGGAAVAVAEALRPGTFSALLLVDPVLMKPSLYEREPAFEAEHFVARRRNEWASPEEMIERFADRDPFRRWEPRVLRDYCEHGLLPSPDGEGYVLACPPTVEAAVYAGNRAWNPYPLLRELDLPIRILRAPPPTPEQEWSMLVSPTWPGLVGELRNAEEIVLEEHSHFIPMEAPGLVATHIEELAASVGG